MQYLERFFGGHREGHKFPPMEPPLPFVSVTYVILGLYRDVQQGVQIQTKFSKFIAVQCTTDRMQIIQIDHVQVK